MGIEIYDVLDTLEEKYSLPAGRGEEFLDLLDAVMDGHLAIDKMPDFVKEAFGVSKDDAKAISIQLAGHRLLQLDHYIGGVEKQLIAWGGKVTDFSTIRLKEDSVTVVSLLRAQADKLGLDLPEHLLKRFVYLAKGYLSKERSKDATVTLMKRPMNIGGLGLADVHITKVLGWLDALDLTAAEDYKGEMSAKEDVIDLPEPTKADGGKKIEEKPVTPEVISLPEPKLEPKLEPKPEPKPEPRPIVQEVPKEPKIEKKKPEVKITYKKRQPKPEPGVTSEKSVEVAVSKAAPPAILTTTALTKEVPVIAGELIDHKEKQEIEEHKRKLEKSTPVVSAKSISKEIEKAAGVLLEHATGKKLTKKKAASYAEAVMKGRLGPDRLFQQLKELHGFDGKTAQTAIKSLALIRQEWELSHKKVKQVVKVGQVPKKAGGNIMDRRYAALTKSPSKESIKPVLPGARVSAARTKDEELSAQHEKVDVGSEREARAKDRPSKAKVKLSTASAPPKAAPKERQKVTDVKYIPTLIGPVEELGTMKVSDFRRLASDPDGSARKVADTLSLLEETDYEERIAGIAAWRSSPINQLYLSMVQEGLHSGSSVAEVAAKLRNQGEETLSPAELKAIVTLNSQVKF